MTEQTSVQETIQFLTKNPGYLKWGSLRLASKLNIKVEEVEEAKFYVKNKEIEKEEPQTIEVISENDIEEALYMPNILIVDIETSPISAYVWRLWKQDVYLDQIISDWFALSWSAKWLYSPDTMSDVLTPKEVKNEDDGRIMKGLWHLLNDADIVIAHNGNRFDIPKIKTRFLLNNLPPTSFYHQIDTKIVASKEFGFSSNKLDALLEHFNLPLKKSTDFNLWKNCLKGDEEALKYMEEYNRYDVEGLEQVYLVLRPWIKNHPNVTLYDDREPNRCPSCGGNILHKEDFYYTTVGKFQVYRCNSCKALSRSRKAIKRSVVTANLSLGR